MLSGKIELYDQPKKVATHSYYAGMYGYMGDYEPFGTKEELEKEIEKAKAMGFIIGAKVTSKITNRTGEIASYADNLSSGFDGRGQCTPLMCKWPNGTNGYTVAYGIDEVWLAE